MFRNAIQVDLNDDSDTTASRVVITVQPAGEDQAAPLHIVVIVVRRADDHDSSMARVTAPLPKQSPPTYIAEPLPYCTATIEEKWEQSPWALWQDTGGES